MKFAPLAPWSLFAMMLAAAGLPIYIHAPKFFVDSYGVSLAALGGVLALLRLIDVVQDPALGWLAERTRAHQGLGVGIATLMMGAAMLGLFAITPPIAPLLWFAVTLTLLFSAYSYLTIVFYAQGVTRAADLGPNGHIRLAGWRETGSLIGVSLAAVAPAVLGNLMTHPMQGFALGFGVLCGVAWWAMRAQWAVVAAPAPRQPVFDLFRPALSDPKARNLLILALINSAPVAVTSTLFLFFVESRLGLPNLAGPYLLVFFLSAALSAPLWGRLGAHWGEKRALLAGMGLAILSFLWALSLGTGQAWAFAAICFGSGAALGADTVLLPAIFARRMADLGSAAAGFGLWSFVSKLSLAIAAATLLPILGAAGFQSGGTTGLGTLTLLYAGLPCVLKLIAMASLALTYKEA